MENWKLHEDHDTDVKIALGNNLRNGMIRTFNGEEFHRLMKELGHTSMDFKKCICNKNK